MSMHTLSSREFTRDVAAAKQWALSGPVVITDRGQPSHVLLTFEQFQRITAEQSRQSLLDAMDALPSSAGADLVLPPRGDTSAHRIPDFGTQG